MLRFIGHGQQTGVWRRWGVMLPLILWLLCLICPSEGHAQSNSEREYLVKAAFLYNFAKFVEWPSHAFDGPNAPIIVCIHGEAAYATAKTVLAGKQVQDRPVKLLLLIANSDPPTCHLAFFPRTGPETDRSILQKLEASSTLTVSDIEDLASESTVVGLFQVRKKIRFDVNLELAGRAGLKISSRLLKLARKVKKPGDPG